MQACSTVFSEEMIAEICASVLLGLVYLHRNHNIHRVSRRTHSEHTAPKLCLSRHMTLPQDIKAGNVLLSPEGRAKLGKIEGLVCLLDCCEPLWTRHRTLSTHSLTHSLTADFGVSAQLNNTMSKRRTVIGK